MPTKAFLELNSEKKERITEAAFIEFARYGYENSSTNRLVRSCGISKGSLFKYFENKEDLYFYLIETAAAEMSRDINSGTELPADLIERILTYSEIEISWYIDHPVMGGFMIGIASEHGEIYDKLTERYGSRQTAVYEALLADADMSGIHHDKDDVLIVIRWVLEGLKNDLTGGDDTQKLKEEYISRLKRYMHILKNGI